MADHRREQTPRASSTSTRDDPFPEIFACLTFSPDIAKASSEAFHRFTILPVSSAPSPPPSSPGAPPAPDRGLRAHLQVLASFGLFFNTWGLINAFGVFETYYRSTLLLPAHSPGDVAWIGTLTGFLVCAGPLVWGPVCDRGAGRVLVRGGSVVVVLGLMMTSLCREYWQLVLAQGMCCGLGGGALLVVATSIVPGFWVRGRAWALGVAASGSGLGGILYPIVFARTHPVVGFGWSVRIVAFLAMATLGVPCVVLRPRDSGASSSVAVAAATTTTMTTTTTRGGKGFSPALMRDLPYQVFNLATFFGFAGQYIPYFFIQEYTRDHSLGLGAYALVLLNVGSLPGRILPSWVADRISRPLGVLFTTTLAATILVFAWIGIRHSTGGLVVWCLLYGFCSGAFVSLQGACVANLTSPADVRTSIGTRFGLNMFGAALGILIGSPVAGTIFPRSWPGAQAFAGTMLALSTVAVAGTGWTVRRVEAKRTRESTRE